MSRGETSISPAVVIAEIGVNHNGDVDLAKALICEAQEAGADIVKFQFFEADKLATAWAAPAAYQAAGLQRPVSQQDMLRQLELSREEFSSLSQFALSMGIEFLASVFDETDFSFLKEINCRRLKIPSGEVNNPLYLRQAAATRLPILLSSGMSEMTEIADAIFTLHEAGVTKDDIIVMHCTSSYPTALSDVNLRAMNSIGKEFDVDVGYSDHTTSVWIPAFAVAMGAKVVEKHFTLDNDMPGPDHKASLNAENFAQMVRLVREAESALGSHWKHCLESEQENRELARKSIVASRDIEHGEVFSVTNLALKRPGNGLPPTAWESVIGSSARRDFLRDELIEL